MRPRAKEMLIKSVHRKVMEERAWEYVFKRPVRNDVVDVIIAYLLLEPHFPFGIPAMTFQRHAEVAIDRSPVPTRQRIEIAKNDLKVFDVRQDGNKRLLVKTDGAHKQLLMVMTLKDRIEEVIRCQLDDPDNPTAGIDRVPAPVYFHRQRCDQTKETAA